MPRAVDSYKELVAYDRFLELVRMGTPELNAALEVEWTPAQLRALQQDPEFRELISVAKEEADGSIEQILYREAHKGKQWAVQMWLFNRQPDRWRDLKRIEIKTEHTVSIGQALTIKDAALKLLRQEGVDAVQSLPAVIETTGEET